LLHEKQRDSHVKSLRDITNPDEIYYIFYEKDKMKWYFNLVNELSVIMVTQIKVSN